MHSSACNSGMVQRGEWYKENMHFSRDAKPCFVHPLTKEGRHDRDGSLVNLFSQGGHLSFVLPLNGCLHRIWSKSDSMQQDAFSFLISQNSRLSMTSRARRTLLTFLPQRGDSKEGIIVQQLSIFTLPMKMAKSVFSPSTSTNLSHAAGHRVSAKSSAFTADE